jgi:hypothetical protein
VSAPEPREGAAANGVRGMVGEVPDRRSLGQGGAVRCAEAR